MTNYLIPLASWSYSDGYKTIKDALFQTFEGTALDVIRKNNSEDWPQNLGIGEGEALQILSDYKELLTKKIIVGRINLNNIRKALKIIVSKRNYSDKNVAHVLQGLFAITAGDGEVYDYFQGTPTKSESQNKAAAEKMRNIFKTGSDALEDIFSPTKYFIIAGLLVGSFWLLKKKIL